MNDAARADHPEDLLSLFALHALEPAEEERVQAHVEHCPQCRQSLALEFHAATALGQLVNQQSPPPALQVRVMRAVARTHRQTGAGGSATPFALPYMRWTRLALPLAASLLVVFLSASLVMHYLTATRLANLARENQEMAQRLAGVLTATAQEQEAMGQLRAANYMIADPNTHRMILKPDAADTSYQGVLLVSQDGRHAMLLVAGMAPLAPENDWASPDSIGAQYQVWLMRPDKKVAIGALKVDTSGRGTADLLPQESVFGFDWLALSAAQRPGAAPSSEQMLLRTRIVAGGPAR